MLAYAIISLHSQVYPHEEPRMTETATSTVTTDRETETMRFEGVHHVTCITGDAPGNVDFYTRVLGLRMVKKTVNQDDPTVYHLFYADEAGSPGSDITFFEYPGATPGRAGAGMVHLIRWRVGSEDALDFWADRLADAGASVTRGD